ELQCLRCHPTGASTGGGDQSGLAPSLALASKRLQPDWIVRWIQFPTGIVPDTRMPTFFGIDEKTGKRKAASDKILGGDAEAQIRAIRDHVMTLGGGKVKTGN